MGVHRLAKPLHLFWGPTHSVPYTRLELEYIGPRCQVFSCEARDSKRRNFSLSEWDSVRSTHTAVHTGY